MAVPRVNNQPNPSPLAQPITAITASDSVPRDRLAARKALIVPPQRHASAIPTNPMASSEGSLTWEDIVISTVPMTSIAVARVRQPPAAVAHPVDAAQRELGAGQHQAQHQRLVVDAGHQVHEQQRVARAQPQRADLVHPATLGQPRGGPDDQADADQHHEPVAEHGGDDVVPGEHRDALADPQEQRAVRGRGLPPQAGNRQGEHVVETESGGRPDLIRVQPEPGDLALRQVGVDVLAVHRRGDAAAVAATASGCGRAGCATSGADRARIGPASARPASS